MCGMQYNRTASGIVTEATVLSYVKRVLRIATICFVFAWWIHVLTNGPSKITSALLIANHDVTGSPKYTSYHNQRGTIPYSFLRGSTYMYNTLKYVYCFIDTFAGHQNHPDLLQSVYFIYDNCVQYLVTLYSQCHKWFPFAKSIIEIGKNDYKIYFKIISSKIWIRNSNS